MAKYVLASSDRGPRAHRQPRGNGSADEDNGDANATPAQSEMRLQRAHLTHVSLNSLSVRVICNVSKAGDCAAGSRIGVPVSLVAPVVSGIGCLMPRFVSRTRCPLSPVVSR